MAVPAPLAQLAKDIHVDAVVPVAFVRVRLFVLGRLRGCLRGPDSLLDIRFRRSSGPTALEISWMLLDATTHRGVIGTALHDVLGEVQSLLVS